MDFTTYGVLMAMAVGAMLVGDWMMAGEKAEKRRALAVSTTIRNVAVALLLAASHFPGTAVVTTVLVYAVFCMAVPVAYGKLSLRAANP